PHAHPSEAQSGRVGNPVIDRISPARRPARPPLPPQGGGGTRRTGTSAYRIAAGGTCIMQISGIIALSSTTDDSHAAPLPHHRARRPPHGRTQRKPEWARRGVGDGSRRRENPQRPEE